MHYQRRQPRTIASRAPKTSHKMLTGSYEAAIMSLLLIQPVTASNNCTKYCANKHTTLQKVPPKSKHDVNQSIRPLHQEQRIGTKTTNIVTLRGQGVGQRKGGRGYTHVPMIVAAHGNAPQRIRLHLWLSIKEPRENSFVSPYVP